MFSGNEVKERDKKKSKPFYDKEAKERHDKLSGTRANAGEVGQKVSQPATGRAAEIVAKKFDTNKVYLRELERLQEEAPAKFEEIASGKTKMAAHRSRAEGEAVL